MDLLRPLNNREFALLWGGMTVSLVGDGVYFVAIAWEAYRLSNAPAALSLVGVAWMLPTVACLLIGGAVSDRFDRRHVMLVGLFLQAAAIGSVGCLAVTGAITLGGLLGLVAVYGAAQAFVAPPLEAIVPTLLPADQLLAASALEQFSRPLAIQIVGPVIGGIVAETVGLGEAFLLDAGTFLAAAAAVLAMTGSVPRPHAGSFPRTGHQIAEGLRFVRAHAWLWGALLAAALTLLIYTGPALVLLPFLVKNRLHMGAGAFGAIRAATGIGALVGAFATGAGGLPRRFVTTMFVAWALQSVTLVGYGLAASAWLLVMIGLIGGTSRAVGDVVWGTMVKTLVPNELLGRVSSLDWMVSIGLIPVSFAITAPIAAVLGVRTTLLGAGALAACAMLGVLGLPNVREPECASNGLAHPGSAPRRRRVEVTAGADLSPGVGTRAR